MSAELETLGAGARAGGWKWAEVAVEGSEEIWKYYQCTGKAHAQVLQSSKGLWTSS